MSIDVSHHDWGRISVAVAIVFLFAVVGYIVAIHVPSPSKTTTTVLPSASSTSTPSTTSTSSTALTSTTSSVTSTVTSTTSSTTTSSLVYVLLSDSPSITAVNVTVNSIVFHIHNTSVNYTCLTNYTVNVMNLVNKNVTVTQCVLPFNVTIDIVKLCFSRVIVAVNNSVFINVTRFGYNVTYPVNFTVSNIVVKPFCITVPLVMRVNATSFFVNFDLGFVNNVQVVNGTVSVNANVKVKYGRFGR